MRVFISWSGEPSRSIADRLREWVPCVIQDLEPWMSTEDIRKGSRWPVEMTTALETAGAGILCLTPGNVDAPWLAFEAGALSKAVANSSAFVCTYLYGLEPADLARGPLALFQHTKVEKGDTFRMLQTLNSARGAGALQDSLLGRLFEKWWPDLESSLRNVPKREEARPRRTDRELLEDIWELLREQSRTQLQMFEDAPVYEEVKPSGKPQIIDLMAALKASLDADARRPTKKSQRKR